MKKTALSTSLGLAISAALAVGIAACSGGGKGGGEDTGILTNCQVVWANSGAVAGRFDIYIVDMPIEQWFDGQKTYNIEIAGSEISAVFYNELLVASNAYYSRGITTNGTFNVTAAQGTNMGEPVTLVDDGNQSIFDLPSNDVPGNQVGDGGAANFDGVWSDPTEGAAPTPGLVTGRVTINYLGVAESVGSYTRYAVCYHQDQGFAPLTPSARIIRQLQKQPVFRSP